MKVRAKPAEFDAWQFTTERNVPPRQLNHPSWVSDALSAGMIWYQGGDQPYFTREGKAGWEHAGVGDWLIRAADGSIKFVDAEEFELLYEKSLL